MQRIYAEDIGWVVFLQTPNRGGIIGAADWLGRWNDAHATRILTGRRGFEAGESTTSPEHLIALFDLIDYGHNICISLH